MRVVIFIHHSPRHLHSSIFWSFIFRVCSHVHFQSLVQTGVMSLKNPRLEDLHILIMVPRGDHHFSFLSSTNIPKEAGDLNIEFLEWQKDELPEKLLLYRQDRLVEEKDECLIDEMEENFVFVSLAEDDKEDDEKGQEEDRIAVPNVQSSTDELIIKQFNRKLNLISYHPASNVRPFENYLMIQV